jgi:hypothetical protein
VQDIVEAIAAALQPLTLQIPGLQIDPFVNGLPTPPTIDIYPDPGTFLERSAMGPGSWEAVFVVRARVSTTDQYAGQQLLLDLMDPRPAAAASLIGALEADPTLGGTFDDLNVEFPSGYGELADPASERPLLGVVWRARVIL